MENNNPYSVSDTELVALLKNAQHQTKMPSAILIDATVALIERLMSDNTCLRYDVGMQINKIKSLQSDVERQQKHMMELAKKLPVSCGKCTYYDHEIGLCKNNNLDDWSYHSPDFYCKAAKQKEE